MPSVANLNAHAAAVAGPYVARLRSKVSRKRRRPKATAGGTR